MSLPRVSVLMPVRNQARFVGEAVESVLTQDFSDYEFLIVDNHSDDETPSVLQQFAARDTRIRLFINDSDIGVVANWNRCLTLAQGEIVKFICGDDLLLSPHALRRLVELLDAHPSAVMAVSARQIIDEESRLLRLCDELRRPGQHDGRSVLLRCLRETHNVIGEPSAAVFRRGAARRGFHPECSQLLDLEMWFHLLEQGSLAYTPEPLCGFREHPAQLSIAHLPKRRGEAEYVRLLAASLDKDWVRARMDRDLMFRQVRWLAKRRDCTPEAPPLEARLRGELGTGWYPVCWLRYKLGRLLAR